MTVNFLFCPTSKLLFRAFSKSRISEEFDFPGVKFVQCAFPWAKITKIFLILLLRRFANSSSGDSFSRFSVFIRVGSNSKIFFFIAQCGTYIIVYEPFVDCLRFLIIFDEDEISFKNIQRFSEDLTRTRPRHLCSNRPNTERYTNTGKSNLSRSRIHRSSGSRVTIWNQNKNCFFPQVRFKRTVKAYSMSRSLEIWRQSIGFFRIVDNRRRLLIKRDRWRSDEDRPTKSVS